MDVGIISKDIKKEDRLCMKLHAKGAFHIHPYQLFK